MMKKAVYRLRVSFSSVHCMVFAVSFMPLPLCISHGFERVGPEGQRVPFPE